MSKPFTQPLSAVEFAAVPDSESDFSDIAEQNEAFWARAQVVLPDRTLSVTLRVKKSVLDAFKAQGRGYQTRMNAVLETYAQARLK